MRPPSQSFCDRCPPAIQHLKQLFPCVCEVVEALSVYFSASAGVLEKNSASAS